MQKRNALLIAFIGLSALMPNFAHAQKAQDSALCWDPHLPPEIVVSRCTAVINAGPARDRRLIAFFARGVAYQRLNWLSSAIADYTEVLRLRPNEERTLNNRGVALSYKGEHDRAIADFNRSLKLKPKSPETHLNRGLAYYEKREYARAIADYDQALRAAPRDAKIIFTRGNAYSALGQSDRAMADYDAAVRIAPQEALAYYN